GLTLAEAMNELAFLATGMYGHPLRKQHGPPSPRPAVEIRLQERKVACPHRADRRATSDFLEFARPARIRLLGQRQPHRTAPAVEPAPGTHAWHRRGPANPALQRLWRMGYRTLSSLTVGRLHSSCVPRIVGNLRANLPCPSSEAFS